MYTCAAISFIYLSGFDVATAQVTKDNTLSTEVNTDNNLDFTVEAGEERGNNFFSLAPSIYRS